MIASQTGDLPCPKFSSSEILVDNRENLIHYPTLVLNLG